MTVLADTSVWVEYLRQGPSGRVGFLDDLLAGEDLLVCGPVVAELLAGTSDRDGPALALRLGGLPWAELDRLAWPRVGKIARSLRAAGTPVALTDVEVSVAAADAGAELWSFDADFEKIAGVFPELRLFGG